MQLRHSAPLAAAVAAVSLALAVLPQSAQAARPLRTAIAFGGWMRDSDITLPRARAAGATAVRLYTEWWEMAPGGTEKPSGFDPEDPADERYWWKDMDRRMRGFAANGLEPVLSIERAPPWAERSSGGAAGTNLPDPTELGRFAKALARRYSGGFGGLPRARYFQVWNEPNFQAILSNRGGPVSPAHYRAMVNAVADAVKSVHRDNKVVTGGTVAYNLNGPAFPSFNSLPYMGSLLCMTTGRRPRPTCGERIRFDVWAHHPYTTGEPFSRAYERGGVGLRELPQMLRVLRAAQRARRVVSDGRAGFWVTEFTWDSSPPDPGAVPLRLHARWISESLYLMYRGGVSLVTWFQLRDYELVGGETRGYQGGLYFRCPNGAGCDRPKTRSLRSFRFPFVAYRRGRKVSFWGRTPTSRKGRVSVEQRVGRRWRRIRRVRANRYGVFSGRARARGRGPVRARLLGKGKREASVPFSLRRPKGYLYKPFGGRLGR